MVVRDLQEAHQDLASLQQASQAGEEAIVALQMQQQEVAIEELNSNTIPQHETAQHDPATA